MKTRLTLLIGAAALVTLSFTFVHVETPKNSAPKDLDKKVTAPVGGIIADEVVK